MKVQALHLHRYPSEHIASWPVRFCSAAECWARRTPTPSMPASSSPISSPWLIISIILQLQLMLALLSKAIHLQFEPSFTNKNLANIKFVKQNRSWYTGQDPTFDAGDYIELTPDPTDVSTHKRSNVGQIIYKDRVRFKFNQSVVSFKTSFVFKIITTSDYGESGNGMAFFISNFDHAPSDSEGAYLGLAPDDTTQGTALKFFAVEFDTFQTPDLYDPSASHIGIDINSLISLNSTDTSPNSSSSFYPELYLYNNYTFTAWIEYDSVRSLIQVWMTNSSSASVRPPQACVQVTKDLSSVFEDYMYVGFTATNMPQLVEMEGHNLFSWSFSSDESPNATAIGSSNFTRSSSANATAIHQKKPSSSHNLLTIVVVTTLITLALIAFAIILFFNRKKRRERQNKFPPSTIGIGSHKRSTTIQLGSINQCSLSRYSYKELKRYCQGFSDECKIGEGGFSSVYKATLPDGSMLAVKRLKESLRKEADFSAEIRIISSIRHRNLLQLLGWCYEKGEAMLVYDYMNSGSLEKYIYGDKQGSIQSKTRLKILVGVASALDYLHSCLGECILHRDVKAANVLLTQDFEPKLGDFGLARLISHDGGGVTMTAVGTPGYTAPEVVYLGKFTDKSDVYSFGVLALKMAYGRPAILRVSIEFEESRIVDYVWLLHQNDRLTEALDPSMLMDMTPSQKAVWTRVLHVAMMCCHPMPESRPTMRQVFQVFKGESTDWIPQPLPKTKPLYPISTIWPSTSRSSTTILAESGGRSSEAHMSIPQSVAHSQHSSSCV